MAKVHHLEWSCRAECLEALASSYGEHPPTGEVPRWWKEFEAWYQEQKKKAKEGVVEVHLRTEAYYYEDEDEDEDDEGEEEEDEGEPGDDEPESGSLPS